MALYEGPSPSPSPGLAPRSGQQFAQQSTPSPTKMTPEQAAAAFAGASTGATANDPFVFLGYKNNPAAGGTQPKGLGSFALTQPQRISDVATLSQVTGQYYSWDQKTKDKFLANVTLAGYDVTGMPDSKLAALWGSYVQQAAQYYANGVAVTPWDIMTKDGQQRESYMNKPRTVTQKGTAYDISTEGDARAIYYTAAQQLLGRDPTKAEARDFQKRLNVMERANPTITTTTSNYIGDTLQSQTSTQEGGVKEGARQMEAMDTAKANPEFGAYQAATTYMDALMKTIGGMT